jgi:hypothetical protein
LDDAFEKLTARVSELAGAVRALEARVATLETPGQAPTASADASAESAPVPPPAGVTAPAPPTEAGTSPFESLSRTIALAGRGILALGGAFLIRALTEAGALPAGAGVTLGLVYALAWLFLAERGARRDDRLRAAADALTATLVVCPLVWEAATRLGVLPPGAAAAVLGVFAALGFALSAVRNLPAAGWFVALGVLPAAFSLLVATHAVATFVALLLAVGGLSLGAANERGWTGLPWLPALAADLAVVSAGFVATRPAAAADAYAGVSPGLLAALAFLLAALYLGAAVWRTALRRHAPSALDWFQTPLAVVAGLGTAAWIGAQAGFPDGVVGAAAGAGAAALYALAGEGGDHVETARFHALLALLLALAAIGIVLPAGARYSAFALLGFLAAILASRGAGPTAAAHAAVYLVASAVTGSLAGATADAFFAAASAAPPPVSAPALLILAASAASYALLTAPGARGTSFRTRVPALIAGILSALGAGIAIVPLLSRLFHAGSDPAALAAIRSGVLAAAALLLAAGKRRPRFLELSWLVGPLLGLGGLKIVFDDLPNGRPATLFLTFALYGLALVFAPRLLRSAPAATRAAPAP